MLYDKQREIRWLRAYKLIACIGVTAVILPVFQLFSTWAAGKYTLPVTLCAVPLLLAFGYAVQWLLLPRRRAAHSGALPDGRTDLGPGARFLALLIAAAAGGVAGWFFAVRLILLQDLPLRNHLGPYLFAPLCAAVAVIGSLLVPAAFHRLLSMRNMTEFFGVLVLIFGLRLFWFGGVDLLLPLCLWVYFLCLSLTLNQTALLKSSHFSATCHATGEMRWAGIFAVLRMWVATILFQIPLLLVLSFVVMPLRLTLTPNSRYLWEFPFENARNFNLSLYMVSLAAVPLSIVFLLLRARHAGSRDLSRVLLDRLRELWHRLRKRLRRLLPERKKAAPAVEPIIRHYTDTRTELSLDRMARVWNPRSFRHRMSALGSNEERYIFAYRVLISKLLGKEIGLRPTQTPHEMVHIICSRTTLSDMPQITETYLRAAYAKDDRVTDEEVSHILTLTLALLESAT